jgi:hypothetical protein
MIDQLDAANFHDAMTVAGLKACRFGVEDYLAHDRIVLFTATFATRKPRGR